MSGTCKVCGKQYKRLATHTPHCVYKAGQQSKPDNNVQPPQQQQQQQQQQKQQISQQSQQSQIKQNQQKQIVYKDDETDAYF